MHRPSSFFFLRRVRNQVDMIDRPYRFVHVVRDPIEQLVSAFLYEKQRVEDGSQVHDKYGAPRHDAFAHASLRQLVLLGAAAERVLGRMRPAGACLRTVTL